MKISDILPISLSKHTDIRRDQDLHFIDSFKNKK